jgi:hypothetical protein
MPGEWWKLALEAWFSGALWELAKVFVTALVAALLAHLLSFRRFVAERWWDRKADAYGSIIGSLVSMIHLLDSLIEEERRLLSNPRLSGRRCRSS